MGLRIFSSSTGENPNPDPFNRVIKKINVVGQYCVCLINYPDCTTFKGDKVMVYCCPPHHIRRAQAIDPHFLESGMSPIARFPGNDSGWEYAMSFAKMLDKQ